MTTLLLSHPACLNHLMPMGHPERPDRLRAVERALEHEKFQTLAREQAPMASLEMIALAHPMDYVEQVREASPKAGMVRLNADTTMSPGTFEAVLRAAGRWGRTIPRRDGDNHSAAARGFRPGPRDHLGGLRRAHARSARQSELSRSRLHLGHAETDGCCRPPCEWPRRFAARRRLRSGGAGEIGRRACHRADAGVTAHDPEK